MKHIQLSSPDLFILPGGGFKHQRNVLNSYISDDMTKSVQADMTSKRMNFIRQWLILKESVRERKEGDLQAYIVMPIFLRAQFRFRVVQVHAFEIGQTHLSVKCLDWNIECSFSAFFSMRSHYHHLRIRLCRYVSKRINDGVQQLDYSLPTLLSPNIIALNKITNQHNTVLNHSTKSSYSCEHMA